MTDPNLFRWPLRSLLKRPFITIFILTLLNPAPLIGDSAQAQALKDYHLSKIRSALDLQEVQMSDEAAGAINSQYRKRERKTLTRSHARHGDYRGGESLRSKSRVASRRTRSHAGTTHCSRRLGRRGKNFTVRTRTENLISKIRLSM